MKPKPYKAQNTKFLEYEQSLLISYATFELLKFENRTDVIIEFSRFLTHRRPGINEGVFGTGQGLHSLGHLAFLKRILFTPLLRKSV